MSDGEFTLKITLGNAAMQGTDDVGVALSKVAAKVRDGRMAGIIQDENGATVGEFGFE